jgi:hypothetical protein
VATDQAPEPEHDPAPPPPQGAAVRRRSRVLLIVLVAVGALVATGAIVGLVVYDRATAIDRSTPTVVAGRFLVATVGTRDINLTSLLICDELAADDALQQAVAGIDDSASVSWHDLVAETTADGATVTAEIRYTATRNGQTYYGFEMWRLRLVNEDGWRVCGIDRS